MFTTDRLPPAPPAIIQKAESFRRAPSLPDNASRWLNAGGKAPLFERGRVYVLAFWTHGCINCKRTLPYWNEWARRFGGTSAVDVLSIHTPEGQWERDRRGIEQSIREQGLRFPVLIDNDHAAWDAYGVNAWPTTVVIDKHGRIRRTWEGELNWNDSHAYESVERLIATLQKERL